MPRRNRTRALSLLVQDIKDESGLSYRELAARARDKGYDISHSQLQAYASDSVTSLPTRSQVDALAAALDVAVREVLVAALAQFYGITVDLPESRDPPGKNLDKPKAKRRA